MLALGGGGGGAEAVDIWMFAVEVFGSGKSWPLVHGTLGGGFGVSGGLLVEAF